MKQFIVEQTGVAQVEVCRRFVVEVPDHFSEEQTEELVERINESFPYDDGMEWSDEVGRNWVGYDVEDKQSDVHDPDTVGCTTTEGLRVFRLEGLDET